MEDPDQSNQSDLMKSFGLPVSFGGSLGQSKTTTYEKTQVSHSSSHNGKSKYEIEKPVKTAKETPPEQLSTTSTTFTEQIITENLDYNIPLKFKKTIPAHSRSVSAITFNPKASRLLTGGMDYQLRLWDFHSMNRLDQSFKHIEPNEGHSIQALNYSCSGSHFICAAGDTICRIYDSDVQPIQETVKGDMYIGDKSNTKGHTHMVTDCSFHPFTREMFMSAAMDATIRIWDLNASPYGVDQALPHLHCLKAVDKRNLNITHCHVLCCRWSPNGAKSIIGGCVDGSLQLWNEKRSFSKPDRVIRSAHNNEITCVSFYSDGFKLLSRSLDDSIKLWDLRKFQTPLHCWNNINTIHSKSSISLSPDDRYIIAPTQGTSKSDPNGSLQIYDAQNFSLVKSLPLIGGGIQSIWPKEINQICVSCTDGSVTFYFDDEISTKGALLFAHTDTKDSYAENDLFDIPAVIFTPDALPEGYRETRSGMIRKVKPRGKEKERSEREVQKSIIPPLPSGKESSGGQTATSRDLSQTIMSNMAVSKIRTEDSVDILRSFDRKEHEKSFFTGKAYEKTQPKKILDYSMDNDDEELLLSSSDKCPRCGLKMCQCGFLNAQKSVFGNAKKFQRTA